MTTKARHGMQKRKKKDDNKGPRAFEVQAWPMHHAPMNRMSQEATVTEAFYAHFLSYFTSKGEGKDILNRLSWLHRLPQLSVDGTNSALTLALQATASSYCAVQTSNPALTRHAWDLYGRAIQMHTHFLSRSRTHPDAITVHMISTSVLFSFFEAMQATSADAYRAHIYGAAKMFEVTDPRQCTQGVLCQIFFHIRTQMAFVQLTSKGEQTPVDVKRILYGALDYEELPIFQRLMSWFGRLADGYGGVDGRCAEKSEVDIVEWMGIKEAVDELWREYTETASFHDEVISWQGPAWQDATTNTTHYRDAYTALTIAYFSATRVLLALAAPYLSHEDAPDHFESILQASHFLETRLIGCAYIRMAAPLLLVALHAPKAQQRRKAIEYFENWKTGSMRGISALAMECISRRQTVV